jgi:hypothetical protein
MSAARPATAGAEVLSRLHLLLKATDPVTPFELRRLESDAKQLENADKALAYIVRSGIAALKWDVQDATRWVERACTLDGSAVTRANAAVTLRHLNECTQASEYAIESYRLSLLDFRNADTVIGVLAAAGRLTEAKEIASEFDARTGKRNEFTFDAAMVACELEDIGCTETQLQRELSAAMKVLSEQRIRFSSVSYTSEEEPDGGSILTVHVRFQGDIETELKVEAKLAELLCDMPDWNPCKLSVELTYVAEDASQPA